MPGRRRNPNLSRDAGAVPWDQPKICLTSGKRMYADEAEANAAAAHILSEERAPAHLSTYKCLYCGAWHLTSKEA